MPTIVEEFGLRQRRLRLLIVEDEPTVNREILENFSALGYSCDSATDYPSSILKIESQNYDCLILDIMLPGGTGWQLLEHLKEIRKNEGVIVLSARNALEDRIKGLQLGADDYLSKPFHMAELSARVAAIIRRRNQDGYATIEANELSINTEEHLVTVNGSPLELTPKEFQLLLLLVVNKNRVLSKAAITDHLWGEDLPEHEELVYTHIKNIRKKIVAAGGKDMIRSVYATGYKLMDH